MIKKLSPKEIKKRNKEFSQLRDIVFVTENLAYAKNVANVFRIADAIRVRKVYLLGETHTPPFGKALKKVSRSKEMKVPWEYSKTPEPIIAKLKNEGYKIIAIEQCDISKDYMTYKYPEKIVFIVGSEMHGMSKNLIALSDDAVIIPMYGKGGSINVHVALGVVSFAASSMPIA